MTLEPVLQSVVWACKTKGCVFITIDQGKAEQHRDLGHEVLQYGDNVLNKPPLRKCSSCGLEAYTMEQLDQFILSNDYRFNRANCCKKCRGEQRNRWLRRIGFDSAREYEEFHRALKRIVEETSIT